MDAELENVLNGLYSLRSTEIDCGRINGNDVVGVMVIDKTGEVAGGIASIAFETLTDL